MKRFALVFLFCFSAILLSADVLYLNEGEEITGSLNTISSDSVQFKEIDGKTRAFAPKEIAHILLSQIRRGDDINHIASISDPLAKAAIETAPTSADFPDSDYAVLHHQRVYRFNPDGSVTHERRKILKILKEAGIDLANQTIYFFPGREELTLEFAHTYAPDGRVFHLTDEALSEESIFSSTPEYDRVKKRKFAMKKVDVGSIIDLSYSICTASFSALFPYLIEGVFGQREPVLREEILIEYPPSLPMAFLKTHWTATGSQNIQEKREITSSTIRLSFQFQDKKGYIPEQNMPSGSRIFPHFYATPVQTPAMIHQAFLAAIASAAPSPQLLSAFISETGAAGLSEPLLQARTIYDAIQRKIRLLGISFGEKGDFLPVSGDITLQKRYGNNFARLCVFRSCLSAIGIKSRFMLVNSWMDEGIQENLPSIAQVQDILLCIDADEAPAYVWCGSDYLPFGHLPSHLQGSTAWIADQDGFHLISLPEGGSAQNRFDRKVFVKVSANGDMEVNDLRHMRGPFETGYRGLRAAKNQDLYNIAQKAVKRVHPKAQLIDYAYSNLNDLNAPVLYSLTYRIPEAAIKASDKILAFKNYWINYNSTSASLATRTYPLQYSQTEETTNMIQFETPKGYSWVPWKTTFNHSCSCMSYDCSLKQTGNVLLYADLFRVSRKYFEPAFYAHYRTCISKMAEVSNQWIILEKQE